MAVLLHLHSSKIKPNFFSLSMAFLFLFALSTKAIRIEKPKESYLPSRISPAFSELPLHVELDIKKLEVSVNKKLNGLIYQGSNIKDKDLSVKVWKADYFTFTINNNEIEYRVPLKIWSRFGWKVEKLGLSLNDDYEAIGTIALKYKTTIGIDNNWKLIAETTSQGYEWIQTPKLNVKGVNVPVKPIASLALSKYDKLISSKIDETIEDSVDLKKYLTQAWNELQKPVQTSTENDIWLRISLRDLLVSPFKTSAGKLNLDIALYGQVESFMGTKPTPLKPIALPPLKHMFRPPQQFNVNVGTDVTFEKISEMAKQELLNETFSEGKKFIQITDLSVFGSDGKAVFAMDVTGSLKGRIYITGDMMYNPVKTAVEIVNPEFELKTRNVLAKSANWLLHGMILKKITPYLTYPVKESIDSLKRDGNTMLKNYLIGDGIHLQGKLNELTVKSVTLIPGAIRIQANLKGNVAVKVDGLNF